MSTPFPKKTLLAPRSEKRDKQSFVLGSGLGMLHMLTLFRSSQR